MTNLVNIKAGHDRDARLDQKLRRELGECVLKLLADERTEDICLNPDTTLWAKRMNQPFQMVGEMSAPQAQTALGTIAAMKGTVINHGRPILETELPLDGSRFEGLVSPVVRSPVFAIRLRSRRVFRLEEYEASEIITRKDDPRNRLRQRTRFLDAIRNRQLSHGEIVRATIAEKKNILVVGSTGSGKTTLVNAILDALAQIAPHDRVVSIEDTTELQCAVRNYVDLRAVGSVTMLDCLRACMRLKPTRIVVGEVRGAEAHIMLKAWNTGHPGGAATVHANDAVRQYTPVDGHRRTHYEVVARTTHLIAKSRAEKEPPSANDPDTRHMTDLNGPPVGVEDNAHAEDFYAGRT